MNKALFNHQLDDEYQRQLAIVGLEMASTGCFEPPYKGAPSRESREELMCSIAWREALRIVLGLDCDLRPIGQRAESTGQFAEAYKPTAEELVSAV